MRPAKLGDRPAAGSGTLPAVDDPELQRVTELLARERSGQLDDTDREELALYRDRPELFEQAHAQVTALMIPGRSEDHAWLARVRDDEALARAEQTPKVRAERGLGLALMAGGWIMGMLGSPIGTMVAGAGVALLLWSLLRVRLANRRDPYDEIKR
jgi:hypothetical protein